MNALLSFELTLLTIYNNGDEKFEATSSFEASTQDLIEYKRERIPTELSPSVKNIGSEFFPYLASLQNCPSNIKIWSFEFLTLTV